MGQYKYVGDSPRVFPDHSLEVEPGQVVDLPENPDPNFFVESAPKAAKAAKSS